MFTGAEVAVAATATLYGIAAVGGTVRVLRKS